MKKFNFVVKYENSHIMFSVLAGTINTAVKKASFFTGKYFSRSSFDVDLSELIGDHDYPQINIHLKKGIFKGSFLWESGKNQRVSNLIFSNL